MHILKLLRNESLTISHAAKAGEALADFRNENVDNPDAALAALAEFGANVTETFNSGLSGLFGGPVLRALGTMVFLEAAKAFDESFTTVEAVAGLDVILLRSSAPKSWREDFLAGKAIDPHVIAIEQPIVNI